MIFLGTNKEEWEIISDSISFKKETLYNEYETFITQIYGLYIKINEKKQIETGVEA